MKERTLVMKFGGASVASSEQFSKIADIVIKRLESYGQVIVVVSAMGDTTDELISLAKQVNPNPPKREYDMLVAVGERISSSLLAMALDRKGCRAISFTGSQSGIITCDRHSEARIVDVKPHRLIPHLAGGAIVVVAGFQGVSRKGEITTLGRGGSDTTAVALGVALGAEKVEFYKDVEGVYEQDPKQNPQAKFMSQLSYEELLLILKTGSQILHERSVHLAKKNKIPLHIRSFQSFFNVDQRYTIVEDKVGRCVAVSVYEEDHSV